MDISLIIENHQIKPAVINLRQWSNDTDLLTFLMPEYTTETTDLSKLNCYAVCDLGVDVGLDKVPLVTEVVDGGLQIKWKVTGYTTQENGHVNYQIVFMNPTDDPDANPIWSSYNAIILVNSSQNADDYIAARYPSILQQWEKRMNDTDASVAENAEQIADASEKLTASAEQAQANADFTKEAVETITQIEKNINELLGYEPTDLTSQEVVQARGEYDLLGHRLDALKASIDALVQKITVKNNGVKTVTDIVFNITDVAVSETEDTITVSSNMAIRLIDPPSDFDADDYSVSPYMGIASEE